MGVNLYLTPIYTDISNINYLNCRNIWGENLTKMQGRGDGGIGPWQDHVRSFDKKMWEGVGPTHIFIDPIQS